jgi:hypothetical protein
MQASRLRNAGEARNQHNRQQAPAPSRSVHHLAVGRRKIADLDEILTFAWPVLTPPMQRGRAGDA